MITTRSRTEKGRLLTLIIFTVSRRSFHRRRARSLFWQDGSYNTPRPMADDRQGWSSGSRLPVASRRPPDGWDQMTWISRGDFRHFFRNRGAHAPTASKRRAARASRWNFGAREPRGCGKSAQSPLRIGAICSQPSGGPRPSAPLNFSGGTERLAPRSGADRFLLWDNFWTALVARWGGHRPASGRIETGSHQP